MKIAIDGRALTVKKPAGKEKFVINILKELFRIDKSHHYILYLNQNFDKELPPNFSQKIIKAPNIFWHFFVVFDLIFERPDLFFAPVSYIIPVLNFFSRNIIVIHDLCVFLSIKTGVNLKTKIIEKMFLKPALRNSQKIVTVSNSTKQDVIRYFKISSQKISVIYHGSPQGTQLASNPEKILTKYNLPNNFILFIGTLEPRKNLVRLIEAYHLLNQKSKIKNQKLVIVGKKGWFYQEIFNKVKELKLENEIIFTGYVPDEDLPYLYKAATCFVYPSLYEGFGLPPLEAMACGCPVITSNLSSLPEVVGEAAILVNPYNIDEITAALEKILTDESLRQNLKERGFKQAQKFSWQKTALKILKILNEVNEGFHPSKALF